MRLKFQLSCCLPLLVGLCLSLVATNLHATHIVGGEMGYTCLGDNQYEIRLTIYRDCENGNPNAYFDDPASIGVFDVNNVLLQDIRINLMGDDTLSPVLTNECLVVPPDVCVHTTTYRTIVELLPRPGGYQLAYQRCCRNVTIQNIVEPLATGATYGVVISERALQECNSSAEFLQWPPLYICANEPIIFDQSAIDIDGDSIVYRLCTPLQGATPNIPQPQPPNAPPYAEIVWNDPPYNVNNMLNGIPGSAPLEINAITGLLTGTPTTQGQFVVGICAEEYRDGELISTSRRDFQYNVGICGVTTAAFFAPEIQCDGLEVDVLNGSVGTTSFLWIFGDPENPLGTSTEPNTSFVFPDTGLYSISLIAAPGEPCADTFFQQIQLLPLTLQPAFSIDTLSCGDSLVLQLNDLSVDELSEIQSWSWYLNGELFSMEQSPLLVITEQGDYNIELRLVAANGCENAILTSVADVSFILETLPNNDFLICPGESVFLNPAFLPQYDYLWSPAASLSDPTAPNPEASPTETTTYELVLTDPQSGCVANRSIGVMVSEALEVSIDSDQQPCAAEITLTATSNNGIRYLWSPVADFSSQVTESASYQVTPFGTQTYYLQVFNEADCMVLDSITITSLAVNLAVNTPDTAACLGESLQLEVTNLDPADNLTYQWQPADQITSGANTAAPIITPIGAGEQWYTFTAINQHGCELMDSIQVTVVDLTEFGAGLTFDQCSGSTVVFSAEDPAAGIYQWHFGDPSAPTATGNGSPVLYTYPSAGTYEVIVTIPAFLDCPDTLLLEVVVEEQGEVNPNFDWEYLSCGDSATVLITDLTTAQNTTIIGWEWLINGTPSGNSPTLEIDLDSTQMIPVSLLTTAENGCQDTLSQILTIPLIDLDLEEELSLCPGASVALNPQGSSAYEYQWSPVGDLDDSTVANPQASPLVTTTYSVTVTDPNSICSRVGEVLVNVAPVMEYTSSPDTTTCANTWQLFVESDQAVTYLWAADPDFLSVLGNTEVLEVNPGPGSTFYFQLTDGQGCSVVDSVNIDGQGVNLELPPGATICRGDSVSLSVASLGPAVITDYLWSPAPEVLLGQGTSEVVVTPSNTTTFTVSATNEFGCTGEASTLVTVFQLQPPLSVTPAIDTLRPGESITLMATDDPSYNYFWSPASSLSATDIPNPVASPEETTTYELVITDANGCTNQVEVLLVVFDAPCMAPYIFVPNAFTPNGDNLNDVLRVEGNVIDEFYFVIYNRWGEEVFATNSQSDGWDGTYKGKELSSDVYGYYLEVSCFGGERYTAKGNVTLLR
ncbi:gliding motility-associated C-terminal domain-containing protein [Lewinella sp. LCG006]|uniref:T9SS type B sorting domain-containing protein n=1 Tax=Lewinella sp. LCG006 TaxID=3231911 RepID=UPI00345FB21E